jgi:hypothetical protein
MRILSLFIGFVLSASYAWSDIGEHWTLLNQQSLLGPRAAHTAVVFDDLIWVLGGNSEDSSTSIVDGIWSSPDGIEWTLRVESSPFGPRRDNTLTVYNGRMWLICGVTADGSVNTDVWSSGNGLDWVQETPNAGLGARLAHEAFVYDGKLWVMGGVVSGQLRQDVWNSTDGENWALVTSTADWGARHSFSSTVFQDKIWVMNGTQPNSTSYNDVWYSEDGVDWTLALAAAPWTPRNETRIEIFSERILVCGGDNSDFLWESSDGFTWVEISDSNWPGRYAHQMVQKDGKLVVIGGAGSAGTRLDDIWVSDSRYGKHSADSDGDRNITLSELLRVVQIYNINGYIYCPEEDTEDGFCPENLSD